MGRHLPEPPLRHWSGYEPAADRRRHRKRKKGFREAAALSSLLPGLEMDGAFIRVDRQMRTNLPGVFAAGDCTGLPLQVAKAVGEGCVAAISAAAN